MAELPSADPSVARSLRLLPWWWVLRWAWLGEAIWVIYLVEDRGLTLGQVLLFDAVFAASAVVAEVPTGIFADRYGRRASMVASSLAMSVAFVIFGLADEIWLLLASYVVFALGEALMSGADDAYLFDSLRAAGRGGDFPTAAGRLNSLLTLSVAGFTILGSLMIIWTPLSWPIVASAALSLVAAAFAWALDEPPRDRERRSFLRTGLDATVRSWQTASLRWTIALFSITFASGTVVFIVFQPFVIDAGAPRWSLGPFAAALMLVAALGSWSAGHVERRMGVRGALRVLPLLAAVSLLGGAIEVLWLFPLLALSQFSFNALQPLVSDYISRRASDAERATALSVNQLAAQLLTIATTLALGVAVDMAGLGAALAVTSGVLAVATVAAFYLWSRAGDSTLRRTEPG